MVWGWREMFRKSKVNMAAMIVSYHCFQNQNFMKMPIET